MIRQPYSKLSSTHGRHVGEQNKRRGKANHHVVILHSVLVLKSFFFGEQLETRNYIFYPVQYSFQIGCVLL